MLSTISKIAVNVLLYKTRILCMYENSVGNEYIIRNAIYGFDLPLNKHLIQTCESIL